MTFAAPKVVKNAGSASFLYHFILSHEQAAREKKLRGVVIS